MHKTEKFYASKLGTFKYPENKGIMTCVDKMKKERLKH